MDFFPFDDEYVRRLREGDRSTEEHFVSYFTPILRIKLRGKLRSAEEAEDVRQDTFFRVLKALRRPDGGIRDGRGFGKYVLTTCNHAVQERIRGGAKTQPIEDEQLESLVASQDTESELIREQQRHCVRRVLSSMDARERRILNAIFFNDESKAELCKELGVDAGYLRVLLHRAKAKFRKAWNDDETN